MEAIRVENTFEARQSLYDALQSRPELTSFLHMHEGRAQGVAFSPDGRTVAAVFKVRPGRTGDGGVMLWDAASRRRLVDAPFRLEATRAESVAVAFSPDGKTVVAGSVDSGVGSGRVVLWDATNRKRVADATLHVKGGWVNSVAFSPDCRTVATSYDSFEVIGRNGVVLWDVAARKRVAQEALTVEGVEGGKVCSVAFGPDGRTLAAGYRQFDLIHPDQVKNSGVALWDLADRKRLPLEPLESLWDASYGVAFSPDGKTVATGSGQGGHLVIWDVTTRKRLVHQPDEFKGATAVTSVAFSPDGKTIAAGCSVSGGGCVALWEAAYWVLGAQQGSGGQRGKRQWRSLQPRWQNRRGSVSGGRRRRGRCGAA